MFVNKLRKQCYTGIFFSITVTPVQNKRIYFFFKILKRSAHPHIIIGKMLQAMQYSKKRDGLNYKNKGVYSQIKIKTAVDPVAAEDLKQFNEKMEELFEKMPRGVERRCSLKKMETTAIGKTFSAYEKDKAQTLLKFARKYCYNAWFGVDPLMNDDKYHECIKRILVDERIVTLEFYNKFHCIAKYSISRHWTDFKYNQLKHLFAPFKHGASFRFVRKFFSILTMLKIYRIL